MRKLLSSLLVLVASSAYGQGVMDVHEVAKSTNSLVQTIDILGNSPRDVAAQTSSGTVAGYYAIEVYSPASSTSTINCGFEVGVSTALYSVWYGREVVAGTGVYFAVPSSRKLYCMSQNSGGSTRATITQLK